jgi:site-specific DNA-cytosine methylase
VTDIHTGKKVILAEIDLLVGGFPCTQKSSLNRRAPAENLSCVRAGTGATGGGFKSLLEFCDVHRPAMVIMENVVRLDSGGDTGESDYILTSMASLTYAVKRVVLDACDYGSFVPRSRLYFLCWLGAHDIEAELSFLLQRFVSAFLVPSRPLEEFILLDPDELEEETSR